MTSWGHHLLNEDVVGSIPTVSNENHIDVGAVARLTCVQAHFYQFLIYGAKAVIARQHTDEEGVQFPSYKQKMVNKCLLTCSGGLMVLFFEWLLIIPTA